MIVAGFGARSGVSHADLDAVFALALTTCGVARADVVAFASERAKSDEMDLAGFARIAGVSARGFDVSDLARVANELMTHSARVETVKGIAGIAEAAALLGAGGNARLFGPRVATAVATCALAEGDGLLPSVEKEAVTP